MERDKYQVEGFSFQSREDYERALKEKETVAYLRANTKQNDRKALLKIYNRSIEKESFRTVIGLEYMGEIRKSLIDSGFASEDALAPIPVHRSKVVISDRNARDSGSNIGLDQQVKRYKAAYEAACAGRMIKNLVIIVLIFVICAMLFLTYKSQYSVFTYFTDYKEKMREDLIDEYEEWQTQLEQKEQELNEREAAIPGSDG